MKTEIENLVQKSKRSFSAAERLFREGDYDFAASRLYYSLFYLAEALLLTKKISYSKHSAVITGFYEHFVRTDVFSKELHKTLHDAFNLRQEGDYGSEMDVSKEAVQETIIKAMEFIKKGIHYLDIFSG